VINAATTCDSVRDEMKSPMAMKAAPIRKSPRYPSKTERHSTPLASLATIWTSSGYVNVSARAADQEARAARYLPQTIAPGVTGVVVEQLDGLLPLLLGGPAAW